MKQQISFLKHFHFTGCDMQASFVLKDNTYVLFYFELNRNNTYNGHEPDISLYEYLLKEQIKFSGPELNALADREHLHIILHEMG